VYITPAEIPATVTARRWQKLGSVDYITWEHWGAGTTSQRETCGGWDVEAVQWQHRICHLAVVTAVSISSWHCQHADTGRRQLSNGHLTTTQCQHSANEQAKQTNKQTNKRRNKRKNKPINKHKQTKKQTN